MLAGVTGSGKSILMDLLMLVLVGPERARHHFNRSATGSKSDRTIKGYCLLDTKREENGQPQYFHDKGVTTYIAAEFTWPDGSRVETWGLRFEFRNTAENDGFTTPFFCPAPLDRADFLPISGGREIPPAPAGGVQARSSNPKGGRLFHLVARIPPRHGEPEPPELQQGGAPTPAAQRDVVHQPEELR